MTPFSLSSWEDTTIELFIPASVPFKRIKGMLKWSRNVNVLQLVAGRRTRSAHMIMAMCWASQGGWARFFFFFCEIIRVKTIRGFFFFLLHALLFLSQSGKRLQINFHEVVSNQQRDCFRAKAVTGGRIYLQCWNKRSLIIYTKRTTIPMNKEACRKRERQFF